MTVLVVLVGLTRTADAQSYAFPSSPADYAEFYPTAYKDHGGYTDWNCGGLTYGGHHGSDFGGGSFAGMDEGRDITAASDGTVIASHDGEFDRCTTGDCYGGGGFGNYVMIEHADGKVTTYGHMKQWTVAVSYGQWVSCGQFLGLMGSSGYSTGPHVHFQVDSSLWGTALDPFDGPCSGPPSYWLSQGAYAGLPGQACPNAPDCVPAATVSCGTVRAGRNDETGSWATTYYGCSEYSYSGPEVALSFSTPLDEPVTLDLTGLSADLDLYVLSSTACDGTGCVASSVSPNGDPEGLTFDAAAGVTYTVVIDGWEGAVSNYTLTVGCNGVAPPPPPTDPTTDSGTTAPPSTAPATDPPIPLPADTAEIPWWDGHESVPTVIAGPRGGGCQSGGAYPGRWAGLGGWTAGLGVALMRGRRGRHRRPAPPARTG